jgi:toxin ParE1/3/4
VKLSYTLPALAGLDSILAYLADASPQGAKRVQKRLQHVISLLLVQPKMGVPTDDPTIRRLTALPLSVFDLLRRR